MKIPITYSKTPIEETKKIQSDRANDKYSDCVQTLFLQLKDVGDTATLEVDNVNSFKTAFYRRRAHKRNSLSIANKSFVIRDAETGSPIRTGENRAGKVSVILVEDRNNIIRPQYTAIPLTEQYPNMTIEQIEAMLKREED